MYSIIHVVALQILCRGRQKGFTSRNSCNGLGEFIVASWPTVVGTVSASAIISYHANVLFSHLRILPVG